MIFTNRSFGKKEGFAKELDKKINCRLKTQFTSSDMPLKLGVNLE